MYRKIVVSAVAAAAVLGTGTAAMAATSTAPAGSAGQRSASQHQAARPVLKHALHGQFVTRGKNGAFVTHDFARGKVTGVSAKLIVVHTADGTAQRFAVTSATKVRLRSDGQGAPGDIGDVHLGDHVYVTGVGSSSAAARHIVDTGTGGSGGGASSTRSS